MRNLPRRLLVAAIVLTTGCRSEKAAFEFQPAVPQAATAVVRPLAAGHKAAAAVPAGIPTDLPASAAITRRGRKLLRRPTQQRQRTLAAHVHHPEILSHRTSLPQPLPDHMEHKTLHLVLGGLLVAAGVVGGILLGGWLGLGVGVLVVLGGYYFLGLAFGGKHGWREVFQEFFNM